MLKMNIVSRPVLQTSLKSSFVAVETTTDSAPFPPTEETIEQQKADEEEDQDGDEKHL